ncbi:MAG: patatin-like phospholipase family protein [Natronospirillum sp.]|uniref:patatin-like phospholipase family protein n=1 Tax=Natronospirillum sp. TaxID=2812955 RepID=UPI0025EEDE2A|nr:patatin-like phospholipase family protein [Natronospirillum sp.]MCH8551443.1 patatin-like phospholipase family protein [Natronospirillum sp.]
MPTVALTLGSGGARGLAHIGVIQWLEEHDFEIVAIAGSSIGALVGGIHAAGKLPLYRDWVCGLGRSNVLRMLDLSFSRAGLFKGEKIISHLSSMIGDTQIEDLPIPYTAVATDINRERSVWLNEGSLFKAIRCSIAVPTVFTPQFHQGLWLVDGGLIDPVPVAATRHVPADLHLAVNLNHPTQDLKLPFERPPGETEALGNSLLHGTNDKGRRQWFSGILDSIRNLHKETPEEENSLNMVDVLFRSFDIMQAQITQSRLAAYRPDIIIHLERSEGGFFDYDKADHLIKTGYRLADDALRSHLPKPEIRPDEA